MARAPERLTRAVEALDVQPQDRILEIGCGRGVAAALICSRLRGGRLVGLDRSATAVAAAVERAADCVGAGTAEFLTSALADVDPARLGSFDKVLAVNVNLFWVRPARAELALVTELLGPHGRLHLVYEPPGPDRAAHLRQRLLTNLEQAGFTTETVSRPSLLSVTARVHSCPA